MMDRLAFAIFLFVSPMVESWTYNCSVSVPERDVSRRSLVKGEMISNSLALCQALHSTGHHESKDGPSNLGPRAENDTPGIHKRLTRQSKSKRLPSEDAIARRNKHRVRKLTCDRPSLPDHGLLVGRKHHYHVGSKIRYLCKSGYLLHGALWNKCVHINGSPDWYFPTPTCQKAKRCDLSAPENGYIKASCSSPGCIAIYSCRRGYKMTGKYVGTCMAGGKWSNSEFRCTV